jgi:iron complex outermembrane receptor protein
VAALCGLAAGPFLAPAPANAQQLEEVVVTAQRRAERLQDVPISVTAQSATALESAGVKSTDELSVAVPGLMNARQIRGNTPYIRGVGTQDSSAGNEAAVATYVDGVYFADLNMNIFAFNNLERVEVLKGPQGTLFGRNATGGLINIITRDPKVDPHLDATLGYGSYATTEGSLYATAGWGPVAGDIAINVVKQDDGWGKQPYTGDDVNRRDETAFRSKWLWRPGPDDRVTFIADWSSNKSTTGLSRNVFKGSLLIGGIPFSGTAYDSPGGFTPAVPSAWSEGASLRYQHEFGWGEFSALSAYRKNHVRFDFDQDLTLARLADISSTVDSWSFQNELLLVGHAGRLGWTTGVFIYSNDSAQNPLRVRATSPASNTDLYSGARLDSYAGFVQLDYAIWKDTNLTAGVRFTRDERKADGQQFAAPGNTLPAGTLIRSRIADASYEEPTWRFAIDHKFAPDVLAYASYSRGFKSGLFNVTDLTAPPIAPETLDAYEAGLKSEFFDHTLRLNGAVFHYIYKDIQLSRNLAGVNQLFNAAQGRINGADLEAVYVPPVPVGHLEVNSGLSLLDGTYTSFPNGPVNVPRPTGGNATISADLSGHEMIQSPKWTLSLGADYAIPLAGGELGLNVTFYHNDGFTWEADSRLRQPRYDLINAQVSYAFGDAHRYRVRVWGKNLGDALYYTVLSGNALGDLAAAAAPRTGGIALDVSF